jgi:hypothetical protein
VPVPVRSAGGIRQPEVLDPHHENDIVPVILEEPDHHGTLAVALHAGHRFGRVERGADPAYPHSVGDPRRQAFHLVNLSPGEAAQAVPVRCGFRLGSAADGHGIPASFKARVIRATLCPASRWANIHATTGAVSGSGSSRCARRPQEA